jgi:hypothetical protein
MTTDQTLDQPSTPPSTPAALRQITLDIPAAVALKLSEWHDGTLEDAALTALRLYHGIGPTAHAGLLRAAKTFDATPAKALRTAIDLLIAEADKLKTTPNSAAPRGRPITNQERDTAIFLRITEGATHAEVAHSFGISIVRVGQIMAQQRAMRGLVSGRAKVATDLPAVLMRMSLDGLSAKEAARATGLTVEQIDRAYVAYAAAVPANPTKGDRVSATFAGVHALENAQEPHTPEATPEPEQVLTLKESDAPRKLAIIPPSMRAKQAQEQTTAELPPLVDATPGITAMDLFDTFQLSDE